MKCIGCKWFFHKKEMKGEVNGECRFHPPTIKGFPVVKSIWWCSKGELKIKTLNFSREPGFW